MNDRAVNPIPPVILGLAVAIVIVECAFQLGSRGVVGGPYAIGWRLTAVQDYAFSPVVWEYVALRGDFGLPLIQRFVTYLFIHQSFTHMLFAVVILLALGKFVGDVFSAANLVILLLLSTVGGAIAFGLALEGPVPLIGAYPLAYGLIGAYTYLIWAQLGAVGDSQIKAFRLIGILMALQLIFGILFPGGTLNWVAEIPAFVIGFGASILLAPGGWAAMLVKLRTR